MKAIIEENQFYLAKVRFNMEIKQVENLNWGDLHDITKSSLLSRLSDLLMLRSDYALTDKQKEVVSIAEKRFIKYMSKEG